MIKKDNFNYLKATEDLSAVFSIGHFYHYLPICVEERISKNGYFKAINIECENPTLYKTTEEILNDIFNNRLLEETYDKRYQECEWASSAYIYILSQTDFNLELLFHYIHLDEMYEKYTVYHEMDFSQIFNVFNERRQTYSLLHMIMKYRKISASALSNESGLSVSMINSLKSRKRDIKHLDAFAFYKIAKFLNISYETLLSN